MLSTSAVTISSSVGPRWEKIISLTGWKLLVE